MVVIQPSIESDPCLGQTEPSSVVFIVAVLCSAHSRNHPAGAGCGLSKVGEKQFPSDLDIDFRFPHGTRDSCVLWLCWLYKIQTSHKKVGGLSRHRKSFPSTKICAIFPTSDCSARINSVSTSLVIYKRLEGVAGNMKTIAVRARDRIRFFVRCSNVNPRSNGPCVFRCNYLFRGMS